MSARRFSMLLDIRPSHRIVAHPPSVNATEHTRGNRVSKSLQQFSVTHERGVHAVTRSVDPHELVVAEFRLIERRVALLVLTGRRPRERRVLQDGQHPHDCVIVVNNCPQCRPQRSESRVLDQAVNILVRHTRREHNRNDNLPHLAGIVRVLTKHAPHTLHDIDLGVLRRGKHHHPKLGNVDALVKHADI